MTKPTIQQTDVPNEKQDAFTASPDAVLEVGTVAIMKGPAAAAACDVDKSEEIMKQIALGLHAAGEMALPPVRRGANKFFDTTLGTIVEVGALGLGAFAGTYILTGIVRTGFRNRAERKEAEAEAAEAALLAA